MKKKCYYPQGRFNPVTLENSEDKNKIHQLEASSLNLPLENLKRKTTVNELR
ncbi:hypothetical protein [Alkaliphilus pronyensis]|uniref:hypothetical protein n=1 Tax=Alkaliphilus pronyensis TaxID=1482732 RepID=UPI0018658526|nr:hypothetical protein [Alkaliphilus pronyensis]